MEAMVKKFQQKFRRVKDDMDQWDDLQARLVSQFKNASSIIGRLQLLENPKNFGSLKNLDYIEDGILTKQMNSLQTIMLSMTKTLEKLNSVVFMLAKTLRDAKQQVKGGSVQPSTKQLHHRIGIKPSLADCLEGLRLLHEMYQSEYLLKSSVISALSSLALKPSVGDLHALEQLLVDQPNIPKEEGKCEVFERMAFDEPSIYVFRSLFVQCNPYMTSYLLKKFVRWRQGECKNFHEG